MTADDAAPGLLHAFVLDGRGGGTSLDWEGVAAWRPADGTLWLNLDYASDDGKQWLDERSGLDQVAREALVDRDPRPRALPIGDALLLIVRGINLNQGAQPEDMVSLRCWIDPHRIVTLRHRPVRTTRAIATALDRGAGPRGVGDFVATLVSTLLEPVITAVDAIDDEVAALEDEALVSQVPEQRARIADLRRRAISLRRFIGPQRDALSRLGSLAVPWLTDDHRARLREAADRQTRSVEELDAARERAAVTHEELQSRIDEASNRRLYVLSLVTAVFLPLTFVTGLLGVNVGGVPAQDVPWAFWALCGIMAGASALQLWLFRRWKWI